MSEPDYAAEMKLPGTSTCDDCIHAQRCFGFGFSKPGNSSCDFWPSRFRALQYDAVAEVKKRAG